MLKSNDEKVQTGRRVTEKKIELDEWFVELHELDDDPPDPPDPPPGGRSPPQVKPSDEK